MLSTVREQILSVIDDNGRTVSEIAEAIGRPVPSTRRTLNLLAQQGHVTKDIPRIWQPREDGLRCWRNGTVCYRESRPPQKGV
jgi:DNA-binding IclR family transcriptional regulator